MTDQFTDDLGIALRERMLVEHPDLEQLAAGALGAGVRLQRRRRAAMTLGTCAAVVAIGGAGFLLSGGGTASSSNDVKDPWAGESSNAAAPTVPDDPTTLTEGEVIDAGRNLVGTITTDPIGLYVLGENTNPGAGTGFIAVITGPLDTVHDWTNAGFDTFMEEWPGITIAVSTEDADALGYLGLVDEVPVVVPSTWECTWTLLDNKGACTSDDGGAASIVIRDIRERDAWLGDADKGADPSVFTSEAHGDIFVTVQGGRGTTADDVQQLGQSLTWAN